MSAPGLEGGGKEGDLLSRQAPGSKGERSV